MEAQFATGGAADVALGPIAIGQKIKEMEHTYYLRGFAGAYWRLFLTKPNLAHNGLQDK